jgi:membrane protease YdiL (CAAX protease family)
MMRTLLAQYRVADKSEPSQARMSNKPSQEVLDRRHLERPELITTVGLFVALWLVLDRTASLLGSTRGEHGMAVCAAVLITAVTVESLTAGFRPISALAVLGLGRPRIATLALAASMTVLLLCYYPAFSAVTGAPLSLRPDAVWLALGILAQGGIAEEVVFRGFLFRRVRRGRTFWRAALLSTAPFAAVHVPLFFSLDLPLAAVSLLLAVSISFPLAYLFEVSRGTIWPSALLHATVQSSIKLVETDLQIFSALAIGWIALGVVIPWFVFLSRHTLVEFRSWIRAMFERLRLT